MGKSFTDFDGHGFWANDGKLEIWLMALCDEVDRMGDAPVWLLEARKHWHFQATIGVSGCVDAGLKQIVGAEPARADVLRDLGGRALRSLQSAPSISREYLNSYRLGGNTIWTADVPTAVLAALAAAFDALLAGTLNTDAVSSPVL